MSRPKKISIVSKGTVYQDGQVQALSSLLYDTLNEVVLNACLDKKKAEKLFIFDDHIKYLRDDDLLILDRAYADYSVMSFMESHGKDFLIRLPKHSLKAVNDFIKSDDVDRIIELTVREKQKAFVSQNKLPERLKVRLIKVKLETGGIEILTTRLLDDQVWKTEDFKDLSFLRWGIETYFDRLKNIYEVERFSGKSLLTIEQDFYGMIVLSNLESILNKEADSEIKDRCQEVGRWYEYGVNHSVCYSAFLDCVVELFLTRKRSQEIILEELKHVFKMNPICQRPGRKYPRNKMTYSKKESSHKRRKRISP